MKITMSAMTLALAALLVAGGARADDLAIQNPDQANFNSFSRSVTAAFAMKPMQSAAASGLLSFSVGGYGSFTTIRNQGAAQSLTGSGSSSITLGGLYATKGLPGGIGLSGFIAQVGGSSGTVYGGELRYALLQGSAVNPAITLSGNYTGASGLKDFGYQSYGANLAISKGFLLLTPYAGVGYIWSDLSPRSGLGLQDAHVRRPRGFVGLQVPLFAIMSATLEYDDVGGVNSYNLGLGLSF